ncbi:hypothetical protein D3C80_882230 [compost metagenome]
MQESVGVELDDVAGGVPAGAAGRRRLDDAGLVEQQVALHQVWSLHVQRAAVVDAGHRFELVAHAGQQLADAAAPAGHRHVDRHHRRALGDAVAFEDADAELVDPQLAHLVVEALGAGDHVAQAAEVVGVGELAVVGEEGRGAEQHGAVAVVDDLRNDPVVQRAGVEEHLAAGHQRQQHAAGQAEGVEQRQRHHELVERGEVGHRAHLGDVGQQRVVRMHHALGLAFRAGGEQHQRGIVGLLGHRGAARDDQVGEQPQAVGDSQLALEVLQIQHADAVELFEQMTEARLVDEGARGDQGVDVGGGAGGAQALAAGGVVEQGGDAPGQRQAEHQAEGRRGVGGEHADHLARCAVARHQAGQAQSHLQQRAVGFFLQADVLDQLVVGAEGGLGLEEGLEQGALRAGGDQHVEEDLAQQLAGTAAAQLGRRQLGHRDVAARLDGDAHLRQRAARIDPGQAAEVAARGAVDAHRHDGRAGLGGDEGGAVVDLHQRAGAGDPPLGEDHHRPAAFHQLDDLLDRQRAGRVDRQVRHEIQQAAEQRTVGDLRVHHEHRVDRQEQAEQQAVEERLVVGDDQRARVAQHLGIAVDADAQQGLEQAAQECLEHDRSLTSVMGGAVPRWCHRGGVGGQRGARFLQRSATAPY